MATKLEFINKTDITDGVVTVNVDNVFSSQYEVYQIIFEGIFHNLDVSNGIEGIRFIDNSGSVISGSEYEYAVLNLIASTSFSETKSTSANEIQLVMIADQLSDGPVAAITYWYVPLGRTKDPSKIPSLSLSFKVTPQPDQSFQLPFITILS